VPLKPINGFPKREKTQIGTIGGRGLDEGAGEGVISVSGEELGEGLG
jgi:hypothetical protein